MHIAQQNRPLVFPPLVFPPLCFTIPLCFSNIIGAQGVFGRTSGGATDYYMRNAHGDIVSTVRNGVSVKSYDYDAYGVEKNADPTDTNPFRYCGEYYDEESGLIYLRNRYYSPSNGRFLTEDPAESGLNWYAYCAGNPVNFVDPWGLEIILIGTDEEKNLILDNLQLLTRDKLVYTIDDLGNWNVSYKSNDGDNLNVGTDLVRRIVDDGYVCSIRIESGKKNGADPVVSENASKPGIGTGGKIYFNPYDTSCYALTEYIDSEGNVGVRDECIPLEIALGHELIHVLRFMGGNFIPYNEDTKEGYGQYEYQGQDGLFGKKGGTQSGEGKMEELATTGISYTRPDGTYADAENWVTTENALRAEHGYGRRVMY